MTERRTAATAADRAFSHFALFYDSSADHGLPDLGQLCSEPNSAVWTGGDRSKVTAALDQLERMVAAGAPYTLAGVVEGSRDPDELLDRVRSGMTSLAAQGHSRVYLVGFDTWGAEGWPPPEDLLWFDASLDAALAALPATVICTYDAARLPARAIFYGEETHRHISHGGPVMGNPHYLSPERWLRERLPTLPWLAGPDGQGRPLHVGAFYRGIDDLYAQLGPDIADGIKRGERAIHFIDPAARADHQARLAALGVNVEELERARRLEILGWDEVYLLDGYFDTQRQLDLVEHLVAEPRPPIRLAANMAWALMGAKGSDELIDYEARLNTLLDRYTHTVICAYDLDRFDPPTVFGAIRTHPVVLIDGKLRENSLYERPALRSSRSS